MTEVDAMTVFVPKIEKGIKKPEVRRGAKTSKYANLLASAGAMEVGDSFFSPFPVRRGQALKARLEKQTKKRFTVRHEIAPIDGSTESAEGFRIWRDA